MKDFIFNYGGTIIVSLLLITVIFLSLRKMIKDKRKGKGSCGCNCENCPLDK